MQSTSKGQAIRAYQQSAAAYTPKTPIARDEEGKTDLSYYEQLTEAITESISKAASHSDEHVTAAFGVETDTETRTKNSPELSAAQDKRKERVRAVVGEYLTRMGEDPTSEHGKTKSESTVEFYSRSEKLTKRFEELVKNLAPV